MDEIARFADMIHEHNVPLNSEQIESFRHLWLLIRQGNKSVRLVSNNDLDIIPRRHFFDSLSPLLYDLILENSNVVDLGTGAGLPGIPLAITRPDLALCLIDSNRKKISFVRHVIRVLNLENVRVLTDRIETICDSPENRMAFDVCVSRALTSLDILINWAMPYLKEGGRLIGYKGPDPVEEIQRAELCMRRWNCEVDQVIFVEDVDNGSKKSLVVVKKIKE